MAEAPAVRRVLFLCYQNRRRSATAERVFCKRPDLDVRSAGIARDALVRVNERMLDWADVVFVMEEQHRRELERMFPDHAALARAITLDIPDDYPFLDPELVKLLQARVPPHLARIRGEAHSADR
jgi:predicted protein tyrosine phosphatase